jgi:hypothetical protein
MKGVLIHAFLHALQRGNNGIRCAQHPLLTLKPNPQLHHIPHTLLRKIDIPAHILKPYRYIEKLLAVALACGRQKPIGPDKEALKKRVYPCRALYPTP